MKNFQVAYVPIGVPTFHLESAGAEFERSKELLMGLFADVKMPDEMLLSMDKLTEFLGSIDPDLIILQNVTFANGAYTLEVAKRFSCPIVLWTLREPVIDGGRLRLNSLTGSYSAANALSAFSRRPAAYVFGSPLEAQVKEKLEDVISAAKVRHSLKSLKLAAVGQTPQGFGFGRALDQELAALFGVTLESIEARELIDKAKSYSDEEVREYIEDAKSRIKGLENIDGKNVLDFARLYKAYDTYVKESGIGALASRCWPDFFTEFGTPVCAVISILNDLGVASACETDIYGALSMYIAMTLTGKCAFFGDPASLDEKENTIR